MKRRLAYFSPLPPAQTGIADYSRELLPHLAQLADVTVFAEECSPSPSSPLADLTILPLASYERQRWNYDLAIYQMGNSRYHEAIAASLLRCPGLMVLHD